MWNARREGFICKISGAEDFILNFVPFYILIYRGFSNTQFINSKNTTGSALKKSIFVLLKIEKSTK